MKIDRHSLRIYRTRVKLCAGCALPLRSAAAFLLAALCITGGVGEFAFAEDPSGLTTSGAATAAVSQPSQSPKNSTAKADPEVSQPQAAILLHRVLDLMVNGPAFDAKVRETVWATGRKVVGVGTYEQAGGGSGRYNLQMIMHDGDGKHRLQQICDGRLAWTRSDIAGNVTHRRVDVGRVNEWVQKAVGRMPIAPGLKVGAWAEMLDTLQRDYVLRVNAADLQGVPTWVITAELRQDRREEILAESKRSEWPPLHPTLVLLAVRQQPDPENGFGQLLPVHIEFRSDPVVSGDGSGQTVRRLITLIELYSIRPIAPPPVERFRFENHDAESIINETDRYIQLYGVRLTDLQRRQLRR